MSKVGVVRSLATIALLLAFLIVLPAAPADETNQATKVRFDQPVQIPRTRTACGNLLVYPASGGEPTSLGPYLQR